MLHLEDVLQLKDDEEVKLIIRRHGASIMPALFLAFVLIVVPFFMLFHLFAMGVVGIILFGAAVVLGIGVAVRTFILWDADALIVTNVRVVDVDQRGVFSRFVTEVMLGGIQDISWQRKGLAETLLGTGSLHIQGGGLKTAITAHHISKPEQVQERINDLRQGAQASAKKEAAEAVAAAPERSKLLKGIIGMLEGYSAEELQRIEAVLKARERSLAADAFFAGDEAPKA